MVVITNILFLLFLVLLIIICNFTPLAISYYICYLRERESKKETEILLKVVFPNHPLLSTTHDLSCYARKFWENLDNSYLFLKLRICQHHGECQGPLHYTNLILLGQFTSLVLSFLFAQCYISYHTDSLKFASLIPQNIV